MHEYATGTSVPVTARLLPGTYGVSDIVGSANFTVMAAGTIDYASELDAVLNGRGTSQLTVLGIPITIDATALGVPLFGIGGIGTFLAGSVQSFHFLPGTKSFGSSALSFPFVVNAEVTVDYDPSLDARVSGRGTSTLTVR